MKKFKTKKFLKTFSLVLLGLATIGGVTTLTTHLIKNDKVTIHPTFEVGGLNAEGKYEEDKSTLYTKEKFACEGLQATLDFDSQINYQIFYYDILDNFISSSEVITKGYSEIAPLNGAYARIEITPINDEDNKISFSEKIKYANQLTLKVNKDAKSNVDKKFISYGGKVLQVVQNPNDSYFEYGISFSDVNKFYVSDHFSTTTKTLLDVSGLHYFKFDPTKLGIEFNGSVDLYEFNELPTDDSKITHKQVSNNTAQFNNDTKYVIIRIYSNNDNIQSIVDKLHGAIQVSKDVFK